MDGVQLHRGTYRRGNRTELSDQLSLWRLIGCCDVALTKKPRLAVSALPGVLTPLRVDFRFRRSFGGSGWATKRSVWLLLIIRQRSGAPYGSRATVSKAVAAANSTSFIRRARPNLVLILEYEPRRCRAIPGSHVDQEPAFSGPFPDICFGLVCLTQPRLLAKQCVGHRLMSPPSCYPGDYSFRFDLSCGAIVATTVQSSS